MMSLRTMRQSTMLFSRTLRKTTMPTSLAIPNRLYSNEAGYGDSASPLADHPKQQGQRPHRELEHPGPEPVAEGRPKTGKNSPSYSSSFNGGESSNAPNASGRKDNSGDSTTGAQPKILDERQVDTEANAEVRKHNSEMSKGSEVEATDEKVDKRFWTGVGGKHGH